MSEIFALTNPVYQPAMRIVAAITNAANAQITTTFAHNYATGLVVRLYIAPTDGMQQMSQQVGTILTVPSPTTFTVDINSINFEPFSIVNPPHKNKYSTVVPVGEINSILTQATKNVL